MSIAISEGGSDSPLCSSVWSLPYCMFREIVLSEGRSSRECTQVPHRSRQQGGNWVLLLGLSQDTGEMWCGTVQSPLS